MAGLGRARSGTSNGRGFGVMRSSSEWTWGCRTVERRDWRVVTS